jgi:geranylgeranyl pyrophosphate synthase
MNPEQAARAVDDLMLDIVASDIQILQDASRHIIAAGGKRIRPRVLFTTFLASGGADLARTIPVATAVELVHTATLVHDDINDHGVMRRGRVTINEKWGRTFALLTGDYLFTKVYQLMAPYGDLNITLAEATVALVEGETLQAAAAKDGNLTREIYQKVVARKTASLFRAAAMLGGQLAQADKQLVDTLGEYGFFLGLTFQIVDDLLDLTGDPRLMGKNTGVDVSQGKGVAAAVLPGPSNGRRAGAAEATVEVIDGDPLLQIKQRLIDGGAVHEGQQMAQVTAMQAHTSLDKLPASEHIDGLREIVGLALNRMS